jgi:hypothetical protein
LACFEEFSLLPQEVNSKIHEIDLHLFRKAIYAGAFAVITAITNNFYDYTVIRDFYNLTMCLDIGLCETNYSYFVAEACNQENQRPGTGRLYLEQERASSQEIDVFLKHPEKSYAFFKKSKSLLAYPELAEVALYQHELSSGLGFPRGIPKGLVSNWEAVVILADSLVEIRNEYTFETDIVSYILKFQSSKMSELPVQRVYNKLCMSLEYCSRIRETGT